MIEVKERTMVYAEIQKIVIGRGRTEYKGWVYEDELATAINVRVYPNKNNLNDYYVIPSNRMDLMRVLPEPGE